MTMVVTTIHGKMTSHNVSDMSIPKPYDTFEIQATGLELDFIRRHFTNIPISDSKTVVWTGDFARFLAANLEFVGN